MSLNRRTWNVGRGTKRLAAVASYFLLSTFYCTPAQAATINAATCNAGDVQAAINQMQGGDVVQIPAGTCAWTQTVTIGTQIWSNPATANLPTTIQGAGEGLTVIADNVSGALLSISLPSSAFLRLSGMTLEPAPGETASANTRVIYITGACASGGCSLIRMDHVKFTGWIYNGWAQSGNNYNGYIMTASNVFGVLDHLSIIAATGGGFVNIGYGNYLGVGSYGDNSWAQPDSYGTANALYIEDSTFTETNANKGFALTDSDDAPYGGARFVVRHNTMISFAPFTHGTESTGRTRGCRQFEVYNNTLTCDTSAGRMCTSAIEARSGTGLFFNNILNTIPSNPTYSPWTVGVELSDYRTFANLGGWGWCDGTGPWDKNDGAVYASGTLTAVDNGTGSPYNIETDSSKNWATNQWVNNGSPYSLVDTTQNMGYEISANTANTITVVNRAQDSWNGPPTFNVGDSYQILRAAACIDQPGRGRSILLSGDTPTPTGWVQNALDPVYEWGDTATPALNYNNTSPGWIGADTAKIIASRDFYAQVSPFNGASGTGTGLLSGRPTTCSTGVAYWATDKNTLYQCSSSPPNTWTAYYTPYAYPHPLQSAGGGGGGGSPPWSRILDPSRAIEWSGAGVIGGIPNRTTPCGSTIAPYGTSSSPASPAAINNAIQSCSAGQVVKLGAGSFYLNSGITFNNKSGVTLRGAGPDQTFIYFSGSDPCGGGWSDICFDDDLQGWSKNPMDQPGGSNAASWTGGYAQGSTQITLTNVGSAGLSAGQYVYLDQADDTSDNGGLFICDNTTAPCSLEGGAPGRTINGVDRNQIQIVKITAISGSTYTITPGLYGQNWSAGKNPGAWWSHTIQNSGIEDLSLDHTNSNDIAAIDFFNAFNCWVHNVRSINSDRDHVDFNQAAHNTVENSYFYGTKNAASQSYGVESFIASDNLVLNNIFQHVTSPIMMGPSLGSVFAYNFSINDYYYAPTWMSGIAGSHDAGVEYNLFEGNNGAGFYNDVFHGTSGLNTLFRNRWVGWETGKTGGTAAVQLYAYNRYLNFIGNVLGQPGFTVNYQTRLGVGVTAANAPVYDLGSGNTEGSVTIPNDPLLASTLMRWGNFDTVTNGVRWDPAEVPSGLSQYANPVPPPDHNLPTSFYLSSKPGWWPATKPWPPMGPDVLGGNISNLGGHAYTLPAQDCYTNVMSGPADGTGNPLTFNANTCYGSGGGEGSGPATPTLSLPPYLPINGTITAGYSGSDPASYFSWTFTPVAGGIGGSAGRSIGGGSSPTRLIADTPNLAPAAAFTTPSPTASLATQTLGLGPYQVTVTVTDNTGKMSAPATAYATLVASDLSGVKIYPNPWRKDKHARQSITFDNLTVNTTVKIFTVSGHHVKTLPTSSTKVAWDLTNDSGDKVASGLYVYLITTDSGQKKTGQVAVIK